MPLFEEAYIFDNSSLEPRTVATRVDDGWVVVDGRTWKKILAGA